MNQKLLSIAALFGFLAVGIGAFGAHGLEGKITIERIASFKTGVNYQFYHTFAIFISLWLSVFLKDKIFEKAGWAFATGIFLFSGSLYLLSTQTLLGIESFTKIIGPMTPIGGLFFLIGWGIIFYRIISRNRNNTNELLDD